jgi:hypothetical protein
MLADENFILTIIHKEQVVADEKFKWLLYMKTYYY